MAIDKAVDSTVLDGYFEDIADAIREKDGTQNTYTPAQMPTAIENIPSGGSSHDWSAIGYENEPAGIKRGYDYAIQFANEWENVSDLTDKYAQNKNLVFMPLVNMSNVTTTVRTFNGCSSLISIPALNTSSIVFANYMFQNCSSLYEIPALDLSNTEAAQYMFLGCTRLEAVPQLLTGKLQNARSMFSGCTNLKNVAIFDTSKITGANGFNSTFANCPNLTDTSLDNILQMCINATSYTSTSYKTLARLGISSDYATRIQALPHYQAFLNAGWTTGF